MSKVEANQNSRSIGRQVVEPESRTFRTEVRSLPRGEGGFLAAVERDIFPAHR